MRDSKRLVINIVWVMIGLVLVGLAFLGKVDNFWNGMGSGLLVIGVINILRVYRLNKNEAYREKVEIEISDERNKFIRNKAWAWSGYLFVLIMAISSIVFRIIHMEQLSIFASYTVCLMILLHWISYFILKRKY
jgi:uncharacterized membrane protein